MEWTNSQKQEWCRTYNTEAGRQPQAISAGTGVTQNSGFFLVHEPEKAEEDDDKEDVSDENCAESRNVFHRIPFGVCVYIHDNALSPPMP